MSSPIPISLCGKSTRIGAIVIADLKPEYEVIHFLQNGVRGASELPSLLQGLAPPARAHEDPGEENIGTKNYSKPPRAIILGGGQTDTDIKQMRDACEGLSHVPWLRLDLKKPMPEFGTPAHGKRLAERTKECLAELEEKGEMGKDGMHWY